MDDVLKRDRRKDDREDVLMRDRRKVKQGRMYS
jgi:hypothetical protein